MSKPHYKLKRIQHIVKGDVIYDRLHGGHMIAEAMRSRKVSIRASRYGKFMFSRSYNILAHRGWAVEDTYLEVYVGERNERK